MSNPIIPTDPATGKTLADIQAAKQLEAAITSPSPWVQAWQSPSVDAASAALLQKMVEESGKSIEESVGNLPDDTIVAEPEPSWRAIARQTSPETLAMMQHALRMQPALVASPMGLARLFPGLRK
jgi:hypothetical protein